MIRAYDVATVRAAEAAALAELPPGTLMARAAAGLATAVLRLLAHAGRPAYGARVVLLVGPGDNGGDALLAGARLAHRGARVDALLVADRAHPAGLADLLGAGGRAWRVDEAAWHPVTGRPAPAVTPPPSNERQPGPGDWPDSGPSTATRSTPRYAAVVPQVLARADVAVDGVLGIGGRGGLTGVAEQLVQALPPSVPVISVDLPSGVDPETGELAGTHVRAARTITFGAVKPALLLPPASRAAGAVELVDIGLELPGRPAVERLEPADLAALWPQPAAEHDKYRRGVLGIVAGGAVYTGAAVLSTGGAVRSGAGMVRYVGPPAPSDLVRADWPEAVPGTGQVQAWLVGPGLDPGADDGQRAAAEQALAGDLPCVVDAGALELLPQRRTAPTLLTPHAGELARLLQAHGEDVARTEVEAAPARYARRAAELTGATVLLKGAVTLVVAPEGPVDSEGLAASTGRVRSQAEGPHWLATAGSGDVLAGIAGALLASGLSPLDAATVAVAVHGRAGHLASDGGPVSATSVLDAVPAAIRQLLRREG